MKKKITNGPIPIYIGVYDSLYSDIINGVYSINEHLPSETILAEKYGVSRNTLRQALAILNEDGLIIKSRGKGTIVAPMDNNISAEKIHNPMTTLCRKKIDEVEINYNYGPPTDIATQKLGLKKSDILLAGNCIYKSEKKILGYSFIQVPTSILEEFDVNTLETESIENLLNEKIYTYASKANISIKIVHSNEMESEILGILPDTIILHIESILYGKNLYPFARCKFYFIPEYYNLKFLI